MAKSKTSKTKYPKTIYVGVEYGRDTSYLTAYSDPVEAADLSEEQEVGIYQFVRTAKVRTKTEVV